LRRLLLVDDLAAQINALVADVDGAGPGDESSDVLLALAAERAVILTPRATTTSIRHSYVPRSLWFSTALSFGLFLPVRRDGFGDGPHLTRREHLVDQTVLLGLLSGEPEVAIAVEPDPLE